MPLVAYSDSESEPDQPAPPAKKLRREPPSASHSAPSAASTASASSLLPPLPAAFHDLYATNARASTQDDPALHGGRKRAIPHMDGHWPSHVYLEWHPNPAESRALQALLDRVEHATKVHFHTSSTATQEQRVHSSLLTPLSTPAPLHISLSRTLPLPTDQRTAFLDALTQNVRRSGARPFDASFEGLKWVPNFDRSRWFLVLGARRPNGDAMNRLLSASNQAAKEFGYPELYSGRKGQEQHGEGVDMTGHWGSTSQEARTEEERDNVTGMVNKKDDRSAAFHVSLAWSLEAPPDELRDPSTNEDVVKVMQQDISKMAVRFDVVKAKIGNTIHAVDLALKRKDEKGILG